MNPVRNWILLGLFYGALLAAILWWSIVPVPEGLSDPEGEPTVEQMRGLLIWFAGLLLFGLIALLCLVLWFALSNRDMNRWSGGGFLTPLWTVLLFVPLVQFTSFYMMAQHIRRAQAAAGRTGADPVVLFVLIWLLLPLGVALAQWQMQRIRSDGLHRAPMAQAHDPDDLDWRDGTTGRAGTAGPAEPGLHWYQVPRTAQTHENVGVVRPSASGADPSSGLWLLGEETLHAGPLPAGEASESQRSRRVDPELVPMPASGIAACFFCVASVPLALLGPAGLASSVAGLYARERFLDLRQREPGHRGGRVVSRLHWVALGGMLVSVVFSAWMLGAIFAA